MDKDLLTALYAPFDIDERKELGDVLTGFKEFINNRFSNELAYDELMIINTKGIIYQFFELYLNTNNIKCISY